MSEGETEDETKSYGRKIIDMIHILGPMTEAQKLGAARLIENYANSRAAEGASPAAGWRDIASAPKDGTLILLLCHYEPSDDCGNALEDAEIARTIGSWLQDDENGGWQMAGWDWCHDTHVDGNGFPISWMPLPPSPSEEARAE